MREPCLVMRIEVLPRSQPFALDILRASRGRRAASSVSCEADVVTMHLNPELVLSALVGTPKDASLALLVIVFHARIASVIPILWSARKIVEL